MSLHTGVRCSEFRFRFKLCREPSNPTPALSCAQASSPFFYRCKRSRGHVDRFVTTIKRPLQRRSYRRILPALTVCFRGIDKRMIIEPDQTSSATQPMHVLVVDDDTEIARILSRYFSSHGFRVSTAGDGVQMRRVLDSEPVDIVMLDLGLPGEDGLMLTRHLREHWHGPVIIITGRGESVDRVVGLELGADDYVTKPFDLRELLARVRSVLRRSSPAPAKTASPSSESRRFAFDGYVLDTQSHSLYSPHGEPIALTSGEFALLRVLVENANKVLSRDQLMTHMHGRDAGPYDRSIDVQIGRLRRKIEPDAANPQRIKSIRGTGYLFSPSVQRV